jgi:hypothetical protein
VEANQLGGGPAVDHGPRQIDWKRYDAPLSIDKYFPLRRSVLGHSEQGALPAEQYFAIRASVLACCSRDVPLYL